jgi:hypothetical protein
MAKLTFGELLVCPGCKGKGGRKITSGKQKGELNFCLQCDGKGVVKWK